MSTDAALDALLAERFNGTWWTTPPPTPAPDPDAKARLQAATAAATDRGRKTVRGQTIAELITWHETQARQLRRTSRRTA